MMNRQVGYLFALASCGCWSSPALAEGTWQFEVSPYFYMSGLEGDMGVVEEVEPVAVDLSFGDIMKNLKFALMGTFDARHGRFVASVDTLYLRLGASEDIEIRDVDLLEGELGSTTFITTATAGYQVVADDGLFIDLLGGGRLNAMKTSLDLTGPQRSFSGSKTETWIDPVIGARFKAPIATNWSVKAYGDVGGFGIGSDHTWQLRADVQYDLSSHWSLTGGWRHLDIDYSENGYVFDAAMSGPILAAVYRF